MADSEPFAAGLGRARGQFLSLPVNPAGREPNECADYLAQTAREGMRPSVWAIAGPCPFNESVQNDFCFFCCSGLWGLILGLFLAVLLTMVGTKNLILLWQKKKHIFFNFRKQQSSK